MDGLRYSTELFTHVLFGEWTLVLLTLGFLLVATAYFLKHTLLRSKHGGLSSVQVKAIISETTKAVPVESHKDQWRFKGTSEGLCVFEGDISSVCNGCLATTTVLNASPKQALESCISLSSFPLWFSGCIEGPVVSKPCSDNFKESKVDIVSFSRSNSSIVLLHGVCSKILGKSVADKLFNSFLTSQLSLKRVWKVQDDKTIIFIHPLHVPRKWILLVFSSVPNKRDVCIASIVTPSMSFSSQWTYTQICSQLCALRELITMEYIMSTDTAHVSEEGVSSPPAVPPQTPTQQDEPASATDTIRSPNQFSDPFLSFGLKCAEDLFSLSKGREEEGWVFISETKGVRIMKKVSSTKDTASINCVKGMRTINAPPDFVLRVLMDPQHNNSLDDMLKEIRIVKKVSESVQLLHLLYKAVWPTSPRDFSVCNVVGRLTAHTRVHAACSIVDELIPEVRGYVRGEVIAGGYCITDIPGNPNAAEVTYVTQVDLKGSVPAFVINKLVESQPLCVNQLNKIVLTQYDRLTASEQLLKQFEENFPIDDNLLSLASQGDARTKSDEEKVKMASSAYSASSQTSTVTIGASTSNSQIEISNVNTVLAEVEPNFDFSNGFDSSEEDSVPISTLLGKIPQFKTTVNDSRADQLSLNSVSTDSLLEYPRNEGMVDFRTLSNQLAAKMLEELFHVSNLDIMDPLTYKDQGGDWKFQGIDKDVAIFKKKVSDSPLNSFLGRGIIELPPQEVFNCVRNPNQRFTYDNMLKELHIVKQIEEGLYILHMHHETNQCFLKQSRDFCILVCERLEPNKKMVIGSSIDVAECPPQPGITRGKIVTSGWVIEPYRKDRKLCTQLTYILQVDIGGIPSTLVNFLSRRQPLAVAYIREFLQSTSLTFKEEENDLKPQFDTESVSPTPPRFRM